MKKIFSSLLFLFLATQIFARAYYVTLLGSDSNTGLSEAAAWRTLTYAGSVDSPVGPKDTVYVKAGDYGYEQVTWQKSGIPGQMIVIHGYKTTPKDNPPIVKDAANPYAALITTDMPTYQKTGTTSGAFMYGPEQQYVRFENLQCGNYLYGFSFESEADQNFDTHIEFYNCVAKTIGASDATNTVYNGRGFTLGSMGTGFANSCKLIKCLVTNAQAEAIYIGGNYNQLIDTKVYCNDVNRITDYYILVCGSYNLLTGCYIERLSTLTGNSHGLGFKTNAEQVIDNGDPFPTVPCYHNTAINCTARNLAEGFYVRHRGAKYNRFIKCKGSGVIGNCITIRDGASDNTFEGCTADSCAYGIRIFDTVEDGDTPAGATGHPNGTNHIINGVFTNNAIGVYFDGYSIASDAGDIRVYNCTFKNNKYMFSAYRTALGCTYKNCNIYGTLPATPGGDFIVGTSGSSITGGQFTNCNFYNIENGMPFGFVAASVSGTTANPLFISSTDLRLQSGSTIKDSGVTLPEVKKDFNSQNRPIGAGYSIGAYER